MIQRLKTDDYDLVIRLERAIYPKELNSDEKFFRSLLAYYAVGSFLLVIDGKVVGYCVAGPEENGSYGVKDLAILLNFRSLRLVLEALNRIVDDANGATIETECRDITSYKLMKSPFMLKFVRARGYDIAEDVLLHDFLDSGEDFHKVIYERR